MTLKKEERLKSRKLIQRLFAEGKSFSHFPLKVFYLKVQENSPGLQAGFSVSSKNFKKAVDRNRIKRVMREAYRLQKNELQNQLKENKENIIIFIIYNGNELPEFKIIFDKMQRVIAGLEKVISLK